MVERAFTIDKNGRTVYFQPPPLSAEKRQFVAPLGSNLGGRNQPIRRKRKRNFDGNEYNLIGITRFLPNQTEFGHNAAKNVVRKLNENGWSARVVRWKNQSGVYVKRRPNHIRKGTNYVNEFPMATDYFTGKDSSNLYHELWLRKPYRDKYENAYFENIPKEMWKKRRSNLEERPIVFHRKLSEAQKSKLKNNPQELDRRINNLQQAYEVQREVLITWLMNKPTGIIRATIEREQRQAMLKKYGKNPPKEIVEKVNSMEFDYQRSLDGMRQELEKTEKKLRQYLELKDSIRSYDSKPKGTQCSGCGSKSKSRCRCEGERLSPMVDYDSITPAMEKEARERFVMQYVDEMSDDRSHGNEYLGYAAMKVQDEIEEGKIPKDMKIVKQKIAEYVAEYENENKEYNRLVGDLWEFGDGVSTDYFTDLPFGGEFKNMPKSMKETLFDEIQKEIESFNPQPYREKLDRLSEAFDSDIQYLAHGGQRIVYEPTDGRSGKLKGKVLKVNRDFENHQSFDRFVREQNEFKNTTGYWEDYVSKYFQETAPFMLKYLLPAEPINDNYGDLAKHTVLQERAEIGDDEILEEALEGKETSIMIGDKKYDYSQIGDEFGLDYDGMIQRWKKNIRQEINSRADSGEITKLKQKQLQQWLDNADTTWQNFGIGDNMRFSLLDYEANPRSSFPKKYNRKIKIYHGTDREFNEFNDDFLFNGSAWFTTDKELAMKGYSGAKGKGIVVEREFEESQLNLATPEDEDKYLRVQLEAMGYDGIKYPREGKKRYFINNEGKKQLSWGSADDVYEIWNYQKLKKPKVGGRSQ